MNGEVSCVVATQCSSLEPGQAKRKAVGAGRAMVSAWGGSKAILPANLLAHGGGHSGPVTCVNKQCPRRCWWRTYMCQTPCSAFPISISFHLTCEEARLLSSFFQREWRCEHEAAHRRAQSSATEAQGVRLSRATVQPAPARPADSSSQEGWPGGAKAEGALENLSSPVLSYTWRWIKTARCFQLVRVNIIDSSQFQKWWAISPGKEIIQPKGQTLKNTAFKMERINLGPKKILTRKQLSNIHRKTRSWGDQIFFENPFSVATYQQVVLTTS